MRARLPFLLSVLIAACSPPSAPQDAAQDPADVAPTRPGAVRVFGDWAVGCDNIALCTMASLGSENGDLPDMIMTVLRQPGGEGRVDLSFHRPGQDVPVSPVMLAIDGRRVALAPADGAAAQVSALMAQGTDLDVVTEAGRSRLSLRGASAALRWIDEQQGRVGTVTAIVAKGPRPASAVPAIRSPLTIRAVVPAGRPAVLTPTRRAAMSRRAGCDMPRDGNGDTDARPTLAALGLGRTLVILPCSAGAYNLTSALFVVDGDRIAPARLDAPSGFSDGRSGASVPTVVNAAWRAGELTSHAKARGLGDCGVRQTFVWDGTRLRLSDQSAMPACRGNPNFITTWRAQVVRG